MSMAQQAGDDVSISSVC